MNWREAANRAVEIEQEVQEATIECTGDVGDPGPMSLLSTALSVLADGDEAGAAEVFINIQKWLRDEELEALR